MSLLAFKCSRSVFNRVHNISRVLQCKSLSTTRVNQLKEIKVKEEPGTIIVEAVPVESPRAKYLINHHNLHSNCTDCPLCKLGALSKHIKHTDVLILSQFVDSTGHILPRRVTGLCKPQHTRLDYLIIMAEKAGLIPVSNPDKPPRPEWESFNTYYDESVIEEFITKKRNRG